MKLWKSMELDPEFHPNNGVTPSADEQKRRAARQLARLHHLKFIPANISQLGYGIKVITRWNQIFFFFNFYRYLPKIVSILQTGFLMTLNEATCMVDPALSVKIALGVYLFGNTLLSLGTERHHPIFHAVWNKQVFIYIRKKKKKYSWNFYL